MKIQGVVSFQRVVSRVCIPSFYSRSQERQRGMTLERGLFQGKTDHRTVQCQPATGELWKTLLLHSVWERCEQPGIHVQHPGQDVEVGQQFWNLGLNGLLGER